MNTDDIHVAAPPARTLGDLLQALVRQRLLVIGVVMLVTALATAIAFAMTPVYRAEVVMLPVTDEDSGLKSIVGQFGGLASLAGVNLPSGGQQEEVIAILESRAFTAAFVKDRELMPVLFADRWDTDSEAWTDPQDAPSLEEAVAFFNEQVRDVGSVAGSQTVTLAVEWPDATLAADWANDLAARLNESVRRRDIARAERSIEYLNRQLEKTQVREVQTALFRLLESQLKTVMLAQVNDEYVMRVIDPAVPPPANDFVRPKRGLIIAVGFVLGLVIAAGLVVWRESGSAAARQA
jgi:uncharacterized protein involved in exopolysaccharide biosynthesis